MVEAVRVRRQGYAFRPFFSDFTNEFRAIAFNFTERVSIAQYHCLVAQHRCALHSDICTYIQYIRTYLIMWSFLFAHERSI